MPVPKKGITSRACFAVILLVALAACGSAQAAAPTVIPTRAEIAQLQTSVVTPVPVSTATPLNFVDTPSYTPSNIPTLTLTPSSTTVLVSNSTVIPTNTKRPTVTPKIIVTTINTTVPGVFGGDPATWTPPAPRPTISPVDHYVFQRPIAADHVNYWARNYSYGSTDGGNRPVHHGIDFENDTGTPVIAAADGVVYYAGPDITTLFGPQPNFYGNVIVIQHLFKDGDGQTIYSLYGHLSEIEIKTGQTVRVGQEIGLVGSAGVAIGPHLHFEVRSGNPQDYNATRNPELWIAPYLDSGVLAGRVADLNDQPVFGIEVEMQSLSIYRSAYTYGDGTVNGDPVRGENFVIPDMQPGYYLLFIKVPNSGLRYKSLVYIYQGRTTWVDIHINPS